MKMKITILVKIIIKFHLDCVFVVLVFFLILLILKRKMKLFVMDYLCSITTET